MTAVTGMFGRGAKAVCLFCVALLVWSMLALSAQAHPDIYVSYRLIFKFKGTAVTDIGESWTFDKKYSQTLLAEYDVDQNGAFSPEEEKAMIKQVLANLSDVRYLTYISKDGLDLGKLDVSGSRALVKDDIVTLAFVNHLSSPVDAFKAHLAVQLKDPELVVDLKSARQQPTMLIGAPKNRCSATIADIPQMSFTGAMTTVQEAVVTCQ